jgi:DNA-binding transcriptional LysR family regulator
MAKVSPEGLDWTWLRDFAAVADEGSLSEAARRLGVSQPTLTRRMAALEEHLGSELLHRGPRGIELTEAGEAMLQPVRRMREEAERVGREAGGGDSALSGTVRVSATEGLANHWCTPVLRELQELHPGLRFEIDVSNRNANLLRREADIALRLGRPRQHDLVARRVGAVAVGLYASTEYLTRRGRPRTFDDLANHTSIGFDDSVRDTDVGRWIEDILTGSRMIFRATSLTTQLEAIRAGWGIGVSSIFVADPIPEIERVLEDLDETVDIWLVTHPGLRRSARIRAAFDFLAARFEADGPRIAGRPTAYRPARR